MSVRPPRAAPAARNLRIPRVPMFVGDPAGEAITQGVLAGITPSLAGRAGYVYETDVGSMERAFHGYTRNPQPMLEARQYAQPIGTPVVFISGGSSGGPSEASGTPSSEAGQVFLDARYRALAQRMMRSS